MPRRSSRQYAGEINFPCAALRIAAARTWLAGAVKSVMRHDWSTGPAHAKRGSVVAVSRE